MRHSLLCVVLLMLCTDALAQTTAQKNVFERFQSRANGMNLAEATGAVLSRPAG
jgi:hypothetical protein